MSRGPHYPLCHIPQKSSAGSHTVAVNSKLADGWKTCSKKAFEKANPVADKV